MYQINTLHCWNGERAETPCELDWPGSLTEQHQGSSGGCESPMTETKTTWDLNIAPFTGLCRGPGGQTDDLWIFIEFPFI